MGEAWATIRDFPNYEISSYGRVMQKKTGREVIPTRNNYGVLKVGLYREGKQHTKALRVLVAKEFVEGFGEIYDTPIHLDGNTLNCDAENLAWRPRWFAWQHSRQFDKISEFHLAKPIIEIRSGRIYENVLDAAVTHGLLIKDVWRSIHYRTPTFPYNQVFDIARIN